MGLVNTITCKNKACRYHAILYEGPGMYRFAHMCRYRDAIINGKVDNPDVRERLLAGAEIDMRAVYLCPVCQELINHDSYYLKENFSKSPFGTVRYDVSFPFGEPHCPKCKSKLKYIQNVRSTKIKCPKCGGELISKKVGMVD